MAGSNDKIYERRLETSWDIPTLSPELLAVSLADLARSLESEHSTELILERIVQSAIDLIPGVQDASISLVVNRKIVNAQASSSEMARQIDIVQTETGEGPCLDAIYEQTTVRVPDMEAEQRWPHFAQRAFELGAGSMLSFQLYVAGNTLGALNLFSSHPAAFSDESEHVGLLFAAHAAVAYAGLRIQQQLSNALAARDAQTAELSRSNEDLRRFAYVASHDLQAPLRTIGGFTEVLAASLDRRELTAQQLELIDSITGGVADMHRLIKDLLAYARLEAPRLSTISLRESHDAVVAMLARDIEETMATVTMTGGDQLVLGDAGQIRQLFLNLIHNALTYRAKDRPPAVTTTAQRTPDGMVELAVSDNGIGIPPQHHERVFEMFRKLKKGQGTGIGLAIVARIVDLHGGSIAVQSDGSSGTTLRVRLAAPSPHRVTGR